jgi:hypothetical protein
MSKFAGRQYDVGRTPAGWSWMVFALDGRTPIGRGEAASRLEAEQAARARITAAAAPSTARLAS